MLYIKRFLLLAIVATSLFTSCKKDTESVGMLIQPKKNKLKLLTSEIKDFKVFTSLAPAVKTSRAYGDVLLGSINDSKMGKTSAFFTSQYLLSTENVNFGTNPEVLDFKIHLDASKHEGDSTKGLNFQIHELVNFDINKDSLYPANIDLNAFVGDEVANVNYSTDSFDVVTFELNHTLANKILNTDSENLKDSKAFKKAFKGLIFSVDTNFSDEGMMWKFNLESTKSYLELTYRSLNDNGKYDTVSFKFNFGASAGRFNQYFINNSLIKNTLNNDTDRVFVAAPGVARANINLAPVLTYRDSSNIMIYKAELIVKAGKTEENISLPKRLFLQIDKGDDAAKASYVNDITGQMSNYGGYYDEETSSYHMVITRHIQNLIDKAHNDSILWMIPYNQKVNVHRTILSNGDNNEKISLKITYSKIY